jgi:hypothetical protein
MSFKKKTENKELNEEFNNTTNTGNNKISTHNSFEGCKMRNTHNNSTSLP